MNNKLEIKYLEQKDITPYVNNTRVHPQEQIEQIKSSMKEFGICNPIGLHNGSIVFGHGRFEAMKQLDYLEFPTIDLSHLTDAQRKAYVIADNKIGDNSHFDEELLRLEIEELENENFDLSLLGFDDAEINELMEEEQEKEKIEEEKPEIEITAELLESHNYIVLYFDNEVDWISAKQKLELKEVSAIFEKQTGIGRVIKGSEVLRKLK